MKYLTLCFLMTVPGSVVAVDSEVGRVKSVMHAFVGEIAKTSPYLASAEKFRSPEGRAAVSSALEHLQARVENPPAEFKDAPGFRITFGLLADHVQKTKAIYEKGELEYARLRLNGVTNLCATCHTQTPTPRKDSIFPPFDDLTKKVSYDNATLLFTLRRWEQALAEFDVLIRDFPGSGLKPELLGEIYRRKIAIFARVFRDPKAAVEDLRRDLKNDKLPSDLRQSIKDWILTFEAMRDGSDPSKLKTDALIAYVADRLPSESAAKIPTTDPQLLKMFYLSGLLYERLFKEPDGPQTQQLLYYLARCERSLAPVVWYSISEVYLKECVVRFPKREFSKKCYEAYRDGMNERFQGRNLPEPVQQSVDALKDYL